MRTILKMLKHNRRRFTVEELEEGLEWMSNALMDTMKEKLEMEVSMYVENPAAANLQCQVTLLPPHMNYI